MKQQKRSTRQLVLIACALLLVFGIAYLLRSWAGVPLARRGDIETNEIVPADKIQITLDPTTADSENRRAVANSKPVHSIWGHVEFASGGRPSTGYVVCFDARYPPSVADILAAKDGSTRSGLLVLPVSAQGTFVAEVPQQRQYLLCALTQGHITPRLVRAFAGKEVALILERLYGLDITVKDKGSGPVKTARDLYGRGPTISRPSSLSILEAVEPYLCLLDIDNLRSENTRDSWQFLTTSKGNQASVGPLQFALAIPGYDECRAELSALPVVSHIEEVVIHASCTPNSDWGTLLVSTIGAEGRLDSGVDLERELGTLTFFDEHLTPSTYLLRCKHLVMPLEISGFPVGKYTYIFESSDAYWQLPLSSIDVLQGMNVIDLDLAGTSGMTVALTCNGEEYQGALNISIIDSNNSAMHSYFRSGPYCWPLMAPGAYQITQIVPATAATILEGDRVLVRAGEFALHSVSVQEADEAVR